MISKIMQCLQQIIGITTSDCPCVVNGLTSDQQTDVETSTSGLYMDDVEGGVHMKALADVDSCSGFYDLAKRARDNGILTMQNDLQVALSNKYKKNKNAFVGQIGRMSFANWLPRAKEFQGVRIRPMEWSDAVVTITRAQIVLNAAYAPQVSIYRVPYNQPGPGELVQQVAATVTAGSTYTVIPFSNLPIALPFVIDGDLYEYWILADLADLGIQSLDNQLLCVPCTKNARPFGDFVDVIGVQIDSLNDFSNPITDQFSHGLIIDVDIRCNNEQLMCREFKDDDAIAITMAYATRFKASELLIEEVLKSPDVNRYTTMAREYLWGKRNHFRAEYDNRVVYLAAAIDVSASNCYICREVMNQPFISGITS